MNRSNTKPTVSQVVFNYIISLAACISSFQDGSKTTWNHNFWWLIELVSMSTFGSQTKITPRKQTFGLHCQAAWHCRSWTKPVLGSSPCPRPSKQLKSQSHSSPEFPWGDSKRTCTGNHCLYLEISWNTKISHNHYPVLGYSGRLGAWIQICRKLWFHYPNMWVPLEDGSHWSTVTAAGWMLKRLQCAFHAAPSWETHRNTPDKIKVITWCKSSQSKSPLVMCYLDLGGFWIG